MQWICGSQGYIEQPIAQRKIDWDGRVVHIKWHTPQSSGNVVKCARKQMKATYCMPNAGGSSIRASKSSMFAAAAGIVKLKKLWTLKRA